MLLTVRRSVVPAHETSPDEHSKMREPFQPVEFGFRAGVDAGQDFDKPRERPFRHA